MKQVNYRLPWIVLGLLGIILLARGEIVVAAPLYAWYRAMRYGIARKLRFRIGLALCFLMWVSEAGARKGDYSSAAALLGHLTFVAIAFGVSDALMLTSLRSAK